MANAIRRTPEQRLAALQARQAALMDALRKQERAVAKRTAEAHAARVKALGEAVIASLGESITPAELTARLASLAESAGPVEA